MCVVHSFVEIVFKKSNVWCISTWQCLISVSRLGNVYICIYINIYSNGNM